MRHWKGGSGMRRMILVLVAFMLFAGRGLSETAPVHTFAVTSGASNYGIDLGAYSYCQAVYAWDADIGIEFIKDGVEVDSVGLARGTSGSFTVHCDSLNIVRTSATRVSVLLGYPNGPCPSFGGGVSSAMVDADWITITNGYHTAAAGTYSFLPLQPLGEHNLVAFQLSWATADTIWVQVIASNSMMDSSTVFNFGTADAPVYSKRVLLASLVTDTAPSGFSASLTGNYEVVCPFSFLVQDANGYPGIPKFVGIRIRSNGEAITAMKIVMGLATLNTCGGE
jgi:hypothetical protein